MGKDGAEGITKIRTRWLYNSTGWKKFYSSFGMPKAAIELGGIDKVIPLDNITRFLIRVKKWERRSLMCLR